MEINCTVLTSITGGKNDLQEPLKPGKAKWIAYLDTPQESKAWEVRKAYDRFTDPRRNSRVPKILSHQFCNTEYSIWIDGGISLLKPPEELIKTYLKDHDIALFKHPKRTCIYGEAMKTATGHLDDPEIIIEQAKKYEDMGFAKNKGLYECGVLIRRHTAKVIELNNYWWSEYCRHSTRDQISFPFSVDAVGIRVNGIEANWRISPDRLYALRSDFVKITPHNPVNGINSSWRKS